MNNQGGMGATHRFGRAAKPLEVGGRATGQATRETDRGRSPAADGSTIAPGRDIPRTLSSFQAAARRDGARSGSASCLATRRRFLSGRGLAYSQIPARSAETVSCAHQLVSWFLCPPRRSRAWARNGGKGMAVRLCFGSRAPSDSATRLVRPTLTPALSPLRERVDTSTRWGKEPRRATTILRNAHGYTARRRRLPSPSTGEGLEGEGWGRRNGHAV